ncbi:hypothetical protein QP119_09625 [Corynebacterium frankenforstense]|uniref:hypothetical protein n=1 Tax=Corynebacterium TaxID=1716 RepID=UPI00254ADA7E|nr:MULTISPECIES: hypothetical protein [Corynebacterium]MDK6260664.1 hypothetical protein [Corynebacterium frankenforstense]MDK8895578.1 hypothetical protein [Corynebacterium sp. MSK006]
MSTSPDRLVRADAAVAAAALLVASLTACTIDKPGEATTTPAATTAQPTPTGDPEPVDRGNPGVSEEALEKLADEVAEEFGQPVGVAVADPFGVHTGGEIESAAAWSTIKVPIAVAAERGADGASDGSGAGANTWIDQLVDQAITVSDNDAADSLWLSLGDTATASQATDAVLTEGGDELTDVETDVLRSGFSAWGQTDWAVAAQARFALSLPEMAGAEHVVEAMGQISPDQAYGLGRIDGAHFKGGWGPDDQTGAYEVRQFGFVNTDCGLRGLAVATNGGNYDQGQAVLDELARGLDKLVCAPRDAAPQPTATEGATRTDGTSEITRQRTVTPHPTQGART